MASPPRTLSPSSFYGSSYTTAAADFWFDACVLYVRVTNCQSGECTLPEFLAMHFPPRDIAICMEVNGARIAPSEEVSIVLKRNRMDPETNALIYVSTDNLRTSSTIQFRILEQETLLVSGAVERLPYSPSPVPEVNGKEFKSASSKIGWMMVSTCEVGAQGCSFVKAKHELFKKCACMSFPTTSTTLEVCVVGRYMGDPMILTQTVALTARRRFASHGTLNAIPEDNEDDKAAPLRITTTMTELDYIYEEGDGEPFLELTRIADKHKALEATDFDSFGTFDNSLDISETDPEETWYDRGISQGIRLGLGFGLGMCIGLGIGLGLIIRTYRATTKSLDKLGSV